MDRIGTVANKAQYLMQEQMAAMSNSKAGQNAQTAAPSVAQSSAQTRTPASTQSAAVQGQAAVANSGQTTTRQNMNNMNTPQTAASQQITDPARGNYINLFG